MSNGIYSEEESWKEKIDGKLWKMLESANDDEKIPVWLWFVDIDQSEIDEQVGKETGLTADNLAVDYGSVPDELVKALESASEKKVKDAQRDPTGGRLKAYVNETENQRIKERQRTETYVKAKRRAAWDAYGKKNSALIKELKLPEKDITFQSRLTPSTVVNLTRAQILETVKSADVVSIGFYDDTKSPPCILENQQKSMRADIAKYETGLTGSGVNIMLYEGWVISDIDDIKNIIHPENIKNVYQNKRYNVETERSAIPDTPPFHTGHHANSMAASMQAYASNANIFAVAQGEQEYIEWALVNYGIDILSHSLHGSPRDGYSNNTWAKWWDALAASKNVILVGATGNSTDDYPEVGSYCAIFGGCYNTIGAGAYYTNGNSDDDIMHDKFRYNPIVYNPGSFDNGAPGNFPDTDYRHYGNGSGDQVCYKPDMVIASDHTSGSAASLSGIISLMIELKPELAAKPEVIKAILMASCHRKVKPANVDGGPQEKMSNGLTQRQGAGAIDVYRALSIITQGQYGTGTITSGSQVTGNIQKPKNGSNLNVSLTWFTAPTLSRTMQELDLSVQNNSPIDYPIFYPINPVLEIIKRNSGKKMVYLPLSSVSNQFSIKVTRASAISNILNSFYPVRYAYAWSTEGSIPMTIDKKYEEVKGILGNPTSPETTCPDGIGRFRHYQYGSIYKQSPEKEPFEIHGPIFAKWASLGYERSFLGYPKTDECNSLAPNSKYQRFIWGTMCWFPGQTEAFEVHGAILNRWGQLDWEKGLLGFPITDETATTDGIGRYNHFRNGSIYWKPSVSAHEIYGSIKNYWVSKGSESNPDLGYPISGELFTKAGSKNRYNDFENGVLVWEQTTNTVTSLQKTTGTIAGIKTSRTSNEVVLEMKTAISSLLERINIFPKIGGNPYLKEVTDYASDGHMVHNRKHVIQVNCKGFFMNTYNLILCIKMSYYKSTKTLHAVLTQYSISNNAPNRFKTILDKEIGTSLKAIKIPSTINILSIKTMKNGDLNFYIDPFSS